MTTFSAARPAKDGLGETTPNQREIRLSVMDARAPAVRRRIAEQSRRLDRAREREELAWIEHISEFDED